MTGIGIFFSFTRLLEKQLCTFRDLSYEYFIQKRSICFSKSILFDAERKILLVFLSVWYILTQTQVYSFFIWKKQCEYMKQ